MSDTPRTDTEEIRCDEAPFKPEDFIVLSSFARQLERELNEANAARDEAVYQALTAKDSIIKERNQLRDENNRITASLIRYEGAQRTGTATELQTLVAENNQLRAEVERLKSSEVSTWFAEKLVQERDAWRECAEGLFTFIRNREPSLIHRVSVPEPLAAFEKLKGAKP